MKIEEGLQNQDLNIKYPIAKYPMANLRLKNFDFPVVSSVSPENDDLGFDLSDQKLVKPCKKCGEIKEVRLYKRGSTSFEINSWVWLFPLGIFYSPWRHLSPKILLCASCAPKPRKKPSKSRTLFYLLILIGLLALLLYFKKDIDQTYQQLQLIKNSLNQIQ